MPNAFARKLRRFSDFADDEMAAVVRLSSGSERRPRGSDLIRQGERPDTVQILLSGWACRYKVLGDGRRQILAVLLPGDLCDLHVSLLDRMDHNIGLLTHAQVASVSARDLLDAMERFPNIERAILCLTLAEAAILREWLVDAGRRDATARLGHRLCELRHRMAEIGLVDRNGEFDLPLSQEDMGDSLGLSSVHVNRIFTRFREQGLIRLKRRRVTLVQPERLAGMSGFDPAYLHSCAPLAQRVKRSGNG